MKGNALLLGARRDEELGPFGPYGSGSEPDTGQDQEPKTEPEP
ncbi:hypothetical protein [Streptomyces humicola]|nr:hypothetical protein [Streptomyces humicola]